MITTEQYDSVLEAAAEAQKQYPSWRWGQAVFNALYWLYPDEANMIRGTKQDMFYRDDKVDEFKEYLNGEG